MYDRGTVFKIRDFSRFTRVSVKMLRHYDELGLLKPARVDPATGYRYYSAAQVPRLNRIIALKDLGFSLEQIANALKDDLSLDELRGMLKLRRAEIENQLRQEQQRLAQVTAQLQHLERQAQLPPYAVVLRAVPPQLVASLRGVLPDADDALTALFEELEAYIAQHQARAALSPLAIYHDADYREEQVDVEAAVPLNRPVPSSERVTVRELPGVPAMACVVYEGSYERGLEALHALSVWVETNGYEVVGPMREVYLRFGADEAETLRLPKAFLAESARDFVTEIQMPVGKPGEHG